MILTCDRFTGIAAVGIGQAMDWTILNSIRGTWREKRVNNGWESGTLNRLQVKKGMGQKKKSTLQEARGD